MVAFAFLEPSSSIRAASSEAELRFIAVRLTLSPCGTRARKPRLLPVVGFAVPGGTPDELPRH